MNVHLMLFLIFADVQQLLSFSTGTRLCPCPNALRIEIQITPIFIYVLSSTFLSVFQVGASQSGSLYKEYEEDLNWYIVRL